VEAVEEAVEEAAAEEEEEEEEAEEAEAARRATAPVCHLHPTTTARGEKVTGLSTPGQ